MFCKNCGKEIIDGAVFCPYCGANVNAPEPVARPAKSGALDNPVAIVGLVLAFIIPLAGLICSCIGYKKAKYEGYANREFALAGIIISIVEMVVSVISMVIFVVWMAMIGSIGVATVTAL